MKFIDLSVPLNIQTPVYPGDPITKIEKAGIFEKHGYRDHYISVGTHVGTHIDAPNHMIKDGITLDKMPIERFSGKGVYIKAQKGLTLEIVQGVEIQEGDIVLLHTGMSEKYHDPEYFTAYPTLREELVRYFIEKKVKMIGIDSCSVDYDPFPMHRILLQAGILLIENLTGLSELENKKFTVFAFPIKLDLDGAPARVVAQVLEE